MKLTRKQAKEKAIDKWSYLSMSGIDIDSDEYDVVAKDRRWDKYRWHCPLCELYAKDIENDFILCSKKCPIMKEVDTCTNTFSVFHAWMQEKDKASRQLLAKRILTIIKGWDV